MGAAVGRVRPFGRPGRATPAAGVVLALMCSVMRGPLLMRSYVLFCVLYCSCGSCALHAERLLQWRKAVAGLGDFCRTR